MRLPALNSDEFDSLVRPQLDRYEHPPRPVDTPKFAWRYFRITGWQSAVASLVIIAILVGTLVRVPQPWGGSGVATLALTGLGALAFALAPWLYALVLAQAVRNGVLARAEIVAVPSGGRWRLLVPFDRGAFTRDFNPKRSWRRRLRAGGHVLVLVDRAAPRLLVAFGPIE